MPPLVSFPDGNQPHTLTGNFQVHGRFESKHLPHERDILVYLPPTYDAEPDRRFPVLYLQDGQNLFDGATSYIPGHDWRVDETAEALIHDACIEPLIIVGIYNTGIHRIDEYTHVEDEHGRGGHGPLYGRMMVHELKPYIDRHYHTAADAAHTGVGGSSLGGLVSLYLGLTYPEVFGKLAVLSPSVWWANKDILRRVRALDGKLDVRIWLDIGTAEGHMPDRITESVRELRDALIDKGWELGRDLEYFEAEGAGHDESAWAARIDLILRALFPVESTTPG